MKIKNEAGWKLISISTAIIDTKKNFQIFIFLGKEYIDFLYSKMF